MSTPQSALFYSIPSRLRGGCVLLPVPISRLLYPVVRLFARDCNPRPASIDAGPLHVTIRGAEGPEAEANHLWLIRTALQIARRTGNETK